MKAATSKQIKEELLERSPKELLELNLRLARFKKENKELLTYLLFESENEGLFIEKYKTEIDEQFDQINRKNYYYIKKGVRKILKDIKKHIRYSKVKESEIELLLYFCKKLKAFRPTMKRNVVLYNIFTKQLDFIKKRITGLHEDLQYDYGLELEELLS